MHLWTFRDLRFGHWQSTKDAEEEELEYLDDEFREDEGASPMRQGMKVKVMGSCGKPWDELEAVSAHLKFLPCQARSDSCYYTRGDVLLESSK